MPKLSLKPNHKAIRDYYATLQQYEQHDIAHEGAVSSPLFSYAPPALDNWKTAVADFREHVSDLPIELKERIEQRYETDFSTNIST